MRNNLPVTGNEYMLRDGESIVSMTDTKGRITYVNPTFVEVSGFTEDELLGKAHNIVRHPDMPPEAFGDLWQVVQSGRQWTGLVKNRRKNGDYYWVLANVTPLVKAGQVTGYLSVRIKPGRDLVEGAAQAYDAFRNGTATGKAIRHGQVVATSLSSRIGVLLQLPAATRLGLTMGMLAAGLAVLGACADSLLLAALAGGGVLAALAGWYVLHHALVAPLHEATRVVAALAGGDLSASCDSRRQDEGGQLLRALRQLNINLRAMLGDVRRNVLAMELATQEIAAGNGDLAARTEAQAASLEQTASSVAEIDSMAQQNSEHAHEADRIVQAASAVAGQGGAAVAQVGETMAAISASAQRIADITGLIDGIAFQTNLLALNAAVEAARAGEHGRGFAVVAGEVRSLAQRTAGAAREIKQLIDASGETVGEGNRLVGAAAHTMQEVVDAVQRATAIMNGITAASAEQGLGIGQVNHAVHQLDGITQQNAALVEQCSAASQQLAAQAVQLARAVSVFQFKEA